MVGLDRHRGELVAGVEPVESRPPHRAMRRPPGDGADRLLGIETPEGRAADRLDAGRPRHLAEITLLGQPREGGLAHVGLRGLDRDRPEHRDRLVPHLAVRVRPRDPPDGRRVGQPKDGGQPHPGVGVLRRNRREHVLGVVLQVVHGRGPHQRILVLPTRLAAQSVEQTHEAVWSRSVVRGGPGARGRRRPPSASLDSAKGNYAYSGPKVEGGAYAGGDRAGRLPTGPMPARESTRLDRTHQIIG